MPLPAPQPCGPAPSSSVRGCAAAALSAACGGRIRCRQRRKIGAGTPGAAPSAATSATPESRTPLPITPKNDRPPAAIDQDSSDVPGRRRHQTTNLNRCCLFVSTTAVHGVIARMSFLATETDALDGKAFCTACVISLRALLGFVLFLRSDIVSDFELLPFLGLPCFRRFLCLLSERA